jgi:Na+/H+ antiporter NhaC
MLNLPRWMSLALIGLVSVVWSGTVIAGIFERDYQPPESINALFAAVVTALVLDRKKKNDDHKDDKP